MRWLRLITAALVISATAPMALTADAPAKRTAKEALQAFHDLIGSWRGTGTPEGSPEDKRRGFWTETDNWEWQFKGGDAWLKVVFDKGKHFTSGELRYLPEQDQFQLTVQTSARERLTFTGTLKDKLLTLDRVDEKTQETQRVVIHILHNNRYQYRYEVKPANRLTFARLWQVWGTKEGVPFASGDGKPECIVSGGLGTMAVTYNGKTYYVCCSGCRDAFREEPEKYIKEYEAKQKAKGK
jgi:ribosomal protein L24E